MRPDKQTRTNVAVGLGVLIQMGGLVMYRVNPIGAHTTVGAWLVVASVLVIVCGCMSYADGKGYSRSVGLFGILGVVGLIVLVLLPDRAAGEQRVPLRKIISVVGLTTGFGLVLLGLWLHALGEDVRIEQMLGWWPGISMLAGFCLAVGSLPALLRCDVPVEGNANPDSGAAESASTPTTESSDQT